MNEVINNIVEYAQNMGLLEILGFIFGLLCVYYLIKESILTFVFGIAYVIVSFFVFWEIQFYGDFILHIFFLVLNIYGWYYWVKGKKKNNEDELPVSTLTRKESARYIVISIIGVFLFGYFLDNINYFFTDIPSSSLPYWDATTSIFSVTSMWLTAKKKIENWHYWLFVDLLASVLYFYKGIYFYSFLYILYIGMVVPGLLAWKKTLLTQKA